MALWHRKPTASARSTGAFWRSTPRRRRSTSGGRCASTAIRRRSRPCGDISTPAWAWSRASGAASACPHTARGPQLGRRRRVRHRASRPRAEPAPRRAALPSCGSWPERCCRTRLTWTGRCGGSTWCGSQGPGFAIVGQAHHALVDGIAAIEVATLLFGPAPRAARRQRRPDWRPVRSEASVPRATRDALRTRAGGALELARALTCPPPRKPAAPPVHSETCCARRHRPRSTRRRARPGLSHSRVPRWTA